MSIRSKVLSIATAIAICITLFPIAVSAGNTYQITSASDIVTYMYDQSCWGEDNVFIICNDIAISNSDYDAGGLFEGGFTPIGSASTPFRGNVSGSGYTVSNIKINASDIQNGESSYYGLFGYCTDTTVQNLSVQGELSFTDDFTCADMHIGGLAGFADGCGMISCSADVSITFTAAQTAAMTDSQISVGGIVGKAVNTQVVSSSSVANMNFCSALSGNAVINAGGVCGVLDYSIISECTSSGTAYCGSGDPSFFSSGILTCNIGGIAGKCQKTDTSPAHNLISECASGFDAISLIANSGGTPTLNCGGIAGLITDGTTDNCSANGQIGGMVADGTDNACEKYVSIGGIAGKIDSVVSSVCISDCKFSNDISNYYTCANPSTVSAPASTAVGGIAGSVQGNASVSIENCGFFGNIVSTEDSVSSEYQLLYSGGILGKAVTDSCSVNVSGCISNGSQLMSSGSNAYIGGISGYIYGSDFSIQSCLYSGNLGTDGDWQNIYASGIVSYVANNPSDTGAGSICDTICAGTVSAGASNTPAVFTASFAYYLRKTNVSACYSIGSTLTPIVSPSLPEGGNTYTADATAVAMSDANTQGTYSALLQNTFWKWSPLYRLPVFSSVPQADNEKPMYVEPNVTTNRIEIDQITWLKRVGDVISIAPHISGNVPYSIDWLYIDIDSSKSSVGSVNVADKTVTLTGGGKTVVSAVYRIYDTNGTDVVTTATTSDSSYKQWYTEISVLCSTSPVSTTVGSQRFLTSIADNSDLYLIAQQCSAAFTYLPEMVVNGSVVSFNSSSGVKAVTGQTYFVFPLSAGLGNYRYYTVMAGDCVGSGEVDSLDVQRALAMSVKAYEYGDTESETAQKLAADINADGVTDALDVMIISLSANGHSQIVN